MAEEQKKRPFPLRHKKPPLLRFSILQKSERGGKMVLIFFRNSQLSESLPEPPERFFDEGSPLAFAFDAQETLVTGVTENGQNAANVFRVDTFT
jgi:hypothetical protein